MTITTDHDPTTQIFYCGAGCGHNLCRYCLEPFRYHNQSLKDHPGTRAGIKKYQSCKRCRNNGGHPSIADASQERPHCHRSLDPQQRDYYLERTNTLLRIPTELARIAYLDPGFFRYLKDRRDREIPVEGIDPDQMGITR